MDNIMAAFKKIAVVGASGVLGRPVVKQLAHAGFDLTLISRDASKIESLFGDLKGVTYWQAEPSDADALTKALTGTFCFARVTNVI
jgi:short-subunit dehydrogenase